MAITSEQKSRLLAARDRLRSSKSAPVSAIESSDGVLYRIRAEITATRILDRIKANHGIKG